MDLMLCNVVTDDKPKEEKKKNKSFGGTDGGGKFSMVFNTSQPVKAFVAKKRVLPSSKPEKKSPKPFSMLLPASKTPEKTAPTPPKNKPVEKAVPNADKKQPKVKSSKPAEKTAPKKFEKNDKSHKTVADKPAPKKFSLSDEFKKIEHNKKSNIFDKMRTDMPKVVLPEVHPLTEKVFSDATIDSLPIHPHSKKNVADLLGFERLTVVQDLSIPKILNGKDVLIRAQTGSGKTLAYALPLVERLHSQEKKIARSDGILAVVIVPTRELALQTYELFIKLLKPYTWIVSGYLCGGEKRKAEKARLRAGLNILIGTPGRFCDHIKNTESMKLNLVKYLILDEADRLLELGYEKDVKEIVDSIKGTREGEQTNIQTILLSATLTASVKELAGLTLTDPAYVDTSDVAVERSFDSIRVEDMEERITIPATVRQCYILIPPKLRLVTLSGLIAYELNRDLNKVLVFMATQDLVDYHYNVMVEVLTRKKMDSDDEKSSDEDESSESESEDGKGADDSILLPTVRFFKLHGKMTQVERSSVFKEFRNTKTAVLICTDVAARGIDVPCVDLVVQYHAPQILADYVHRVGRTARAGQKGKAIMFVEPAEVEFIKYLAQKQIKLAEEKVDPIFNRIGVLLNCTAARKNKNKEQAAIELQHRFEKLITAEKELFNGACKAFVSWVRYYSNFPRELRRIFAIKAVNMGHYAKSLGLREPPTQIARHRPAGQGDDAPRGERQQRRDGKQDSSWPFADGDGTAKSNTFQSEFRKRPPPVESAPKQRPAFKGGNHQRNKDLASYAQKSRMVNTSEFDSGLPPARKKARKQ